MDNNHPPELLSNTINHSHPPSPTLPNIQQLSPWNYNRLDPAEPDVNNSNSMDDNNQFHPPNPSDLPPIIPSELVEDGSPKYDPLLSDIVDDNGFKTDLEIIQRHQEQNREFRSLSPMEFPSKPSDNNQHQFAMSGQIDPGDKYDVNSPSLQFSTHPTSDNSIKKSSSPRPVKDPDEKDQDPRALTGFNEMDPLRQDSLNPGDSGKSRCLLSGALTGFSVIDPRLYDSLDSGNSNAFSGGFGAIKPSQVTNHQKLQPMIQLQDQADYGYDPTHHKAEVPVVQVLNHQTLPLQSQAAYGYDPNPQHDSKIPVIQDESADGYDPNRANPPIDQKQQPAILLQDQASYGYDSNANYIPEISVAQCQTDVPATLDGSADGYDPNQADPPVQIPLDQVAARSQKPHEHHGAYPRVQYPPEFESGPLVLLAPEQIRFDNAGDAHYNGQFDGRDRSEPQFDLNPQQDALGAIPVEDHREEPGSNPVGQDHWGQPDFTSGQTARPTGQPVQKSSRSRARPYKLGFRSKRSKPKIDVPGEEAEMTVMEYIEAVGLSSSALSPGLAQQQAHLPPHQGVQSHDSWSQQLVQKAAEQAHQEVPYQEQLSCEQNPWEQPILQAPYQDQLPLDQVQRNWEQPILGGLPDEAHQLPLDQTAQWNHPLPQCLPDPAGQYAPYSYGMEPWNQPTPPRDQIPCKNDSWSPQHAPYNDQLFSHEQNPSNQPLLQQLPQGAGPQALHRDQIPWEQEPNHWSHLTPPQQGGPPNEQEFWNLRHAPYQNKLPRGQELKPYQSPYQAEHQAPYHDSLWYPTEPPSATHIPHGTNQNGTGPSPPAHLCYTAQPLDGGCSVTSRVPFPQEPIIFEDWNFRAPANVIPPHRSVRTSISEYTNDTTSCSAGSSPNQFQSMDLSSGEEELGQQQQHWKEDEGFRRAQDAMLSDANVEDTKETGAYANFANSINLYLPVDILRAPAARESIESSRSSSTLPGESPSPSPSLFSAKKRRNRENPRIKRTDEQKKARKLEQNRKDSKKSVAKKKSRREDAAEQQEYIMSLVKRQKKENWKFERKLGRLEDLFFTQDRHDLHDYLQNERSEYLGWKEEISRILDNQRDQDVGEALEKKLVAKKKFEEYAAEYKVIQGKSAKSTVGSKKCRASQEAQLLESEYQILVNSHDLRRETHLKALAELYFSRTVPFYNQNIQWIPAKLQTFLHVNQHLLFTNQI